MLERTLPGFPAATRPTSAIGARVLDRVRLVLTVLIVCGAALAWHWLLWLHLGHFPTRDEVSAYAWASVISLALAYVVLRRILGAAVLDGAIDRFLTSITGSPER